MNELFNADKWSEWCDIEDWRKVHQKEETIQISWDPVIILPNGVEAAWVFVSDTDNLVFTCGKSRGSVPLGSNRYETKKHSQILFFSLAKTIEKVCQTFEVPGGKVLEAFSQEAAFENLTLDERNRLQWISNYCSFFTLFDQGHKVTICVPNISEEFGTAGELSGRKLISSFLLNYSRYVMQNPTTKLVPSTYFSMIHNTPEKLLEYFWSPKSFSPEIVSDTWIWPWQMTELGGELESKSITTTSLCADIRLSTKAMERTIKEANFARFLRDVVDSMRRTLSVHGGFFDKETGDGVIAHFLDNDGIQNGATSAFLAAKQMSREVGEICRNFVETSLTQKLPVGVGIGIHTGNAHWFASQNQINAIGPSVVDAVRISSGANSGEVLLSLGAHRNTLQCLSANKARVKELKKVQFKGIDTEVEAYSMEI